MKKLTVYSLAMLFIMASVVPVPALGRVLRLPLDEGAHRLITPLGDIAFEVVGQVSNLSPTVSKQYGYLSLINGLSAGQIFTTADPTLQNETSALFTFFTDAITERVISDGRLRVVNRTGTTTIYFDDFPDGTFANRDSFADGIPILTMNYRQQVILDTGDGTFTVVNLLTVTSRQSFELGGERFRLGKVRDQFRQFYSGAPPTGTPALSGVFAGYAVVIEPADREKHEQE
ncbi:MAG: hypothetical protein LC770_06860 [Acidobacteria bacterium]|nr:hypothetical protein [Acidobacteriota bacterium]